MCSTLSRRTTVWVDSVVAPCGPSPSTSSTTLDKRSSLSHGRLSACLASSRVVYKRSVKPAYEITQGVCGSFCSCFPLSFTIVMSSSTCFFKTQFHGRMWLQITLFSPTILRSAGGAGSPWQHSGLCRTTVAPVLPKIHCCERTQWACAEDPWALLRVELPSRCWLWGGFIQTQESIKFVKA